MRQMLRASTSRTNWCPSKWPMLDLIRVSQVVQGHVRDFPAAEINLEGGAALCLHDSL